MFRFARVSRFSAMLGLGALLVGCPQAKPDAKPESEPAPDGESPEETPATPEPQPEATATRTPIRPGGPDPHSFADPEAVLVTHMGFDWNVDMDARVLSGAAILQVERKKPGASLVLDTRGLEIESVQSRPARAAADGSPLFSEASVDSDWQETKFEVGDPDPIKGRALTVDLPDDHTVVRITYRTTADTTGLQWLAPEQTAGGKKPFLYSQSQAIHARSWFPCQDSPQVRVKYDAKVTVPKDLVALMSADRRNGGKAVDAEGGGHTFEFEMGQAIPAYLIAVAVGDLEFQEIDDQVGVWADPSIVASAATELTPTTKMIEAAETLFGPYRWGRYDVLILPPAFPFGGMENPKLTFATPTILAGDGSLLSLIAHELAHSWSGNLVTNARWADLWLNEGFTVYAERRMVEAIHGKDQVAMEAMLGRQDLEADLKDIEEANFRQLQPDLKGRDPDDYFSDVPYEKGALLLFALEHAYGREVFDPFIRAWFDGYAFQSVTSPDFHLFARDYFEDKKAVGTAPDLKQWIWGADLPPEAPTWTTDAFTKIDGLVGKYLAGETAANELPWAAWTTHERLHFLRALPSTVSEDQMKELDGAFELTKSNNAEVAAQWFELAAAKGYAPADSAIEAFLTRVGRRKFLVPIYRALTTTEAGKARAKAIYAKARPGYHAISQRTLDEMLDTGAPASE